MLSGTAGAAAEAAPDKPTFAERVGQKKYVPAPDPFGIVGDYATGVRLMESRLDRQVAIKFGDGSPEAKPSQAVLDTIKAAGFRWNPQHKVWTHPLRADSEKTTRINATELFNDVVKMIRQEKGIEAGASPEVPF